MKKKSALFISISMVLVTILALTTASFAWFTTSLNPTVDGFDVEVISSNAIMVGVRESGKTVDDIKFKSSLTLADMKAGMTTKANGKDAVTVADELNQFVATPAKLGDVTPNGTYAKGGAVSLTLDSSNNLDFLKLTSRETIGGDFTTAYSDALNDDAAATPEKNYIKFDIYFTANTAGAKQIKVSLDFTTQTGADLDKKYAGSDFYAIDSTKKERLPFTSAADKANLLYYIPTTLRGAFLPTEVKDKTGTAATNVNPLQVMSMDGRTLPDGLKNSHIDTTKDYKIDFKREIKADGTPDLPVTPSTTTDAGKDLVLFTMDSNSVYKLTTYIWIEGNDEQCINEVSGSMFKSELKFKGEFIEPTPAP